MDPYYEPPPYSTRDGLRDTAWTFFHPRSPIFIPITLPLAGLALALLLPVSLDIRFIIAVLCFAPMLFLLSLLFLREFVFEFFTILLHAPLAWLFRLSFPALARKLPQWLVHPELPDTEDYWWAQKHIGPL